MEPRQPSPKILPALVKTLKRSVLVEPHPELIAIANLLIPDDLEQDSLHDNLTAENPPALVEMWITLLRHIKRRLKDNYEEDGFSWAMSFLKEAARVSNIRRFANADKADRMALRDKIIKLSNELANTISRNDLDFQLSYNNSVVNKGFVIYDDLSEKCKHYIDNNDTDKIKVSDVLKILGKRSKEMLETVGSMQPHIRFLRAIDYYNVMHYEQPLYEVTATATNAIFGTNYGKDDIHHLIKKIDMS